MDVTDTSPVTIRPASLADEPRIAELCYGFASQEMAALAGGSERAARLGQAFFQTRLDGRGEEIFVASRGTEVIGVLIGRTDGTGNLVHPFKLPEFMLRMLGIYPAWAFPGLMVRFLLRAALEFPVPLGSYHIAELHVAPGERNRGVGSRLLDFGVQRARELGLASVNLATYIANPARRLYERAGFAVTETRQLGAYQALTGTEGRIFMEKELRHERASPSAGAGTRRRNELRSAPR